MPAWSTDDGGLENFVATYRCAVVARLEGLYSNTDPALADHRYIILARQDDPQSYVQCLFVDRASRMLCEASSGFYFNKPNEPRTIDWPAAAKRELASLGFDTSQQEGNFQQLVPTTRVDDLGAVAALLLKSLYSGYGARLDTAIELSGTGGPKLAKLAPCQPIG